MKKKINARSVIQGSFIIVAALALIASAFIAATHNSHARIYITLPSAQSDDPKISADVSAKLKKDGQARVFIRFNDPMPLSEPLANRKTAIAESRGALLAQLSNTDFKLKREFNYVASVSGVITEKTLEFLKSSPLVTSVKLDRQIKAHLDQSVPLVQAHFVQNSYGLTGRGVNVAVLDTGMDVNHPDLADSVIAQHCFNDGDCPPNDDDESDSAMDENGHGTNVAGIITANGGVSPIGFAPAAGIVAVRVLDTNGTGNESDTVAGLDWVLDNLAATNVRVINMSLGGGLYTGNCDADAEDTADVVAQLVAQNVIVFAASGNDGSSNSISSPACNTGVISVGATYDEDLGSMEWSSCDDETTAANQITCFTNSNSQLDLVAPGSAITSSGLGGGTSTMSGTSMASPTAAGVAALMLEGDLTLTPAFIENILESTGILLTDPKNGLQFPTINALNAVECVVGSSLSNYTDNFPAYATNGAVTVHATGNCPWTAASNADWITITSGATGAGTQMVGYDLTANTSSSPRTGTLTIARRTLTITQAGCTYNINPTNRTFGQTGGTGTVHVSALGHCPRTAVSNASWITITSGAVGTGNGSVNYSVSANNSAAPRTGTITIAGQTFTVNQDACTYTLFHSNPVFGQSGGTGTATVTTNSGCPWTAATATSWITITSGNSRTGNGGMTYSVAANPTAGSRTGTISIAGYTITVRQDSGCNYTLSRSSQSFTDAGGTGSVNVTVLSGCPWTAASPVSWVTITSGASGNGSGTVNYTVAPNPAINLRSAVLTIAGNTFTVIQAGAPCNYSLSPSSASPAAAGGTASVSVTVLSGCSWTAASSVDWIAITSGTSGNGNGTVSYRVATNPSSSSRTGFLSIAGQIFTVTQSGSACGYSISSSSQSFTSSSSLGGVDVTAGAGCSWIAYSNANWITITSGSSGAGNDLVKFSVAINNTASSRIGTLNIAGHTFRVTQADNSGCSTASINPGETLTGALSITDCRSPLRGGNSYYADRYTFYGTAGQDVAVELISSAFDAYLYLVDPTGNILAFDNNGGVGTNSRIPAGNSYYRLPSNGVYTIEATSAVPNATGNYSLTLGTLGDLIINGGFESLLSPWVVAGGANYTSDDPFPHSGTGCIHLGGANNSTGIAYQNLTIPASAVTAGLSFWLSVTSDETTTTLQNDLLYVEAFDTSGNLLALLATYSNLNKGPFGGYMQQGLFNLQPYIGQTIQLRFRSTTNPSNITTFHIDDVSVR